MEISKKSELRARMLSKRKLLEPECEKRWNRELFNRLLMLEVFMRADTVYCYADYSHEAGTGLILDYLWGHGVRAALPRVSGKDMDFYYVKGREDLSPGYRGIMEPKEECLKAGAMDCPVIVPGLAFDKEGYRLGYGGGYYDKFFHREPGHDKIGIGFHFQLVSGVYRESFDVAMDEVLISGIE